MADTPQSPAEHPRNSLRERLDQTWTRIANAATHSGRNPTQIRLLAVSKGQTHETIRALASLGQSAFGESYVQEAMAKLEALADLPLEWHFIGQIQANKTRGIAERFQWVHSVDRLRIAERLNEQRPDAAPPLEVCLQVRLAPEPGKGGVDIAELPSLARQVAALPKLRLRGLMCTPPPTETFAEQRAWFATLADEMARLNAEGLTLDTLSMGMSGDLEAAIDAGATIVRVGTALFGERTYNRKSG